MEETTFENHPDIIECIRKIDDVRTDIYCLHLGPLNYNVEQALDRLRAAIRLLERFRAEHETF